MNRKLLHEFALNKLNDDSEIKEVLDWIKASDENKKEFIRLKNLWAVADFRNYDVINENQQIISSSTAPKRINLLSILKVAAVFILVFFAGGASFWTLKSFKNKTSEALYVIAIAPEGSVAKTILPDSTEIYLNSGSEIKYDANDFLNNREVFMEGEAWFSVRSNKEKTFVVHTPFYKVNVLGTKFNIKTYSDDQNVVTTLEEGSVLITSLNKFKLDRNIVLKPGEQLVFNKNSKQLKKLTVDPSLYSAWRENKLIFINMSFENLLKLLERKYGVDIEVVDSSLLDENYTGTIKNETILEVMDLIQLTHPVTYSIEGQKIVIRKK